MLGRINQQKKPPSQTNIKDQEILQNALQARNKLHEQITKNRDLTLSEINKQVIQFIHTKQLLEQTPENKIFWDDYLNIIMAEYYQKTEQDPDFVLSLQQQNMYFKIIVALNNNETLHEAKGSPQPFIMQQFENLIKRQMLRVYDLKGKDIDYYLYNLSMFTYCQKLNKHREGKFRIRAYQMVLNNVHNFNHIQLGQACLHLRYMGFEKGCLYYDETYKAIKKRISQLQDGFTITDFCNIGILLAENMVLQKDDTIVDTMKFMIFQHLPILDTLSEALTSGDQIQVENQLILQCLNQVVKCEKDITMLNFIKLTNALSRLDQKYTYNHPAFKEYYQNFIIKNASRFPSQHINSIIDVAEHLQIFNGYIKELLFKKDAQGAIDALFSNYEQEEANQNKDEMQQVRQDNLVSSLTGSSVSIYLKELAKVSSQNSSLTPENEGKILELIQKVDYKDLMRISDTLKYLNIKYEKQPKVWDALITQLLEFYRVSAYTFFRLSLINIAWSGYENPAQWQNFFKILYEKKGMMDLQTHITIRNYFLENNVKDKSLIVDMEIKSISWLNSFGRHHSTNLYRAPYFDKNAMRQNNGQTNFLRQFSSRVVRNIPKYLF
eukprot:403334907